MNPDENLSDKLISTNLFFTEQIRSCSHQDFIPFSIIGDWNKSSHFYMALPNH